MMINPIKNNLIIFKGDVNTESPVSASLQVKNELPLQKEKIKQEKSNNKMTLTKAFAIVFGTAAALLYTAGCFVRFKNKTCIQDVTRRLSETLRRELTEGETKQIVENYKELFKIDDAENFIRKSFEQIKKDYGYEKAEIPLEIEYAGKYNYLKSPFKKFSVGGFNNIENKIRVSAFCKKGGKINHAEKRFVFETLYHELKHMEQAHLCYLKDKNKFFDAIVNYPNENGKTLSMTEKADLIRELEKNYKKAFDKVPSKDISELSEKIDKYIENTANYKDPDKDKVKRKDYKKQILEKEAFRAGNDGFKFFWLDKSVLYIPSTPYLYLLMIASLLCFAKDNHDKVQNISK